MSDISKEISIYIHFPWCVRKCPYCDFNSHAIKDKQYLSENYYKKLIQDFDNHLDDLQGRKVISIFIGGGTPSLFKPEYLNKVLRHIQQHSNFADNIEITLEVNPGTVERSLISKYADIGINRVSLGAQSFQDDKLKILGRIHSSDNIFKTVDEINSSSINNFNIDIMHGLPNQNLDDALYDLKQAISLSPTHLSWYQLTIEPNTLFAIRNPVLPCEKTLEYIEVNGKKLLTDNKYYQYEISAYSQNNRISIHNSNYWQFGDYIGIGAGAHSKITNLETYDVYRSWKHKHPKIYIQSDNLVKDKENLSDNDLVYEFMLNALRLKNGFDIAQFEKTTNMRIDNISDKLNQAISLGLISIDKSRITPTTKGYLFLNNLINIFS